MRYENAVVVPLATARLIRLVTTDQLGDALIVQPAKRWAISRDDPRAIELVDGLECPACVGFWLGWLVLLLPKNRVTRSLLRALALNYVVLHVSSRID